jgi:hypothetical protein
MIEKSSPEFAELLGEAICALSRHFVGVAIDARPAPGKVINGRDKLDPVYMVSPSTATAPAPCSARTTARAAISCTRFSSAWRALARLEPSHFQKQYQVGENITRLQAFPFQREAKPHEPPPPAGFSVPDLDVGLRRARARVPRPGQRRAPHAHRELRRGWHECSAIAPGASLADSPLELDAAGFCTLAAPTAVCTP